MQEKERISFISILIKLYFCRSFREMFAICLKVSKLYPMSQLILQFCLCCPRGARKPLSVTIRLLSSLPPTNKQPEHISPVLSEFVERDEKDGLIMKM